jgi:hypothetical protein
MAFSLLRFSKLHRRLQWISTPEALEKSRFHYMAAYNMSGQVSALIRGSLYLPVIMPPLEIALTQRRQLEANVDHLLTLGLRYLYQKMLSAIVILSL